MQVKANDKLWSVLQVAVALALGWKVFTIAFWGREIMFAVDTSWILRAGEYIVESGRIPSTDVLAWSVPERPWVLYQWLFEVICALFKGAFGLTALMNLSMVYNFVCYFFLPMWLFISRRVPIIFTLAVNSTALMFSMSNLSLRPAIVTSLFLIAQFLIVKRYACGRLNLNGACLWLVLVYALWSNMHTGVSIGLMVLPVMALGDYLQARGVYKFEPADRSVDHAPVSAKIYLIFGVVAALGSVLNPYGWGIYSYLWNLSNSHAMNATINELMSPNFQNPLFKVYMAFMSCFVLLAVFANKAMPARNFLLLLVMNLATLYASRMIVWLGLFSALFVPNALYQLWRPNRHRFEINRKLIAGFERFRSPALIWLKAICVALVILPMALPSPPKMGICEDLAPAAKVYAKSMKLSDRMATDELTGSCLMNYMSNYKVFFDNRFDFYGEEFVMNFRDEFLRGSKWREYMRKWKLNGAILQQHWPVTRHLKEDKNFEVLFEDEKIVIFRHRGVLKG